MREAVTSKQEALRVNCPTCHVPPTGRCVESDGVTWRRSFHVARHTLAIANGARIRYIGGMRVFYDDDEDGTTDVAA